ncbi:Acetylxylan esterase 2 [Cladorrhinum samala]|uniref:Acetylxylan esterase 2 n=1 Tax=Cladorrhinum samala TaxID=585594 RepID=A0AAV9HKB0_9PEZI|nr:Acetylxylan esterase 2 [Cladorrhinum samala]
MKPPFLLLIFTPFIPLSLAQCPDLHILTARETLAPEGHGSNAPLLSLMFQFLSQKSLNVTAEPIPYPASNAPSYSNSVTAGIASVVKRTASFSAICPSTPVVMLGYSQGAQIIDDAFCGGPDLPSLESGGSLVTGLVRRNTAAIVFMGSPRFVGGRGRKGEKGNATVGGFAARPKGFRCPLFEDRITSYCDAPDPFCSNGNDEIYHQAYGDVYAKDALAFILSKIMLS